MRGIRAREYSGKGLYNSRSNQNLVIPSLRPEINFYCEIRKNHIKGVRVVK